MPTLTATTNLVRCFTCYLPIMRDDAQPIRLLEPTESYREGGQVLHVGETVYECDECISREFERETLS